MSKYRALPFENAGLKEKKIAYFSMEIGLSPDFSTYSGGLGVLAGDAIKSAADLKVPLVAVTLVSSKGYFRQELTSEGRQVEHLAEWDPEKYLTLLPEEVEVKIQGRVVKVKAWLYVAESSTRGKVPVLFLDTDVDGNTREDRELTSYLYGGDERYRMKQELILGVGGLRMLEALRVEVSKYHLNEGHAGFLTLELLRIHKQDVDKIKQLCVFTTHTPVEAGHDKFSYELVKEILGDTVSVETLKKFAGQDCLNMTLLALNLSGFANGVTKKHQEVTSRMFPGYKIQAITNGIHSYTWTCASFKKIYDKYLPGWANEPELLARVAIIPNEEIWQARREAKKGLIDYVNDLTNMELSADTLTIGFARRATAYKRPKFLFRDIERLKRINKKYKFQVIFAGKAHPQDKPGKKMIEEIFSYIRELKDEIKIVYLENYDMEIAKKLISGVDVWLNTPRKPLEASGTSGMKAAHNGAINFSVLDGWWIEGCIEGVTGWAIGPRPEESLSKEETYQRELQDIYNKLEYVILPMFYEQRDKWLEIVEGSIGKIACYFNSHRMMQEYVAEAYGNSSSTLES
ncbi:alpha-glucan family phosphorylase [candidate division NPL-UPA2 bacterium]|nr:alpha-glucan family phosphorylase [candidate division NPL-UPA2 bacterium]